RCQVRDDDADVLLLAGSRQKIRKRSGGDVGDRTTPHLLGIEIVEVGRHLIEQDEDGVATLKQFEPGVLIWGLGAPGPEGLELLAPAELVGDLAPEEVVGVIATVEGGDGSFVESRRINSSAAISLAKLRIPGQQTE